MLVLTSSGTGAMEAAVVNLVPRGGKAIVLESGKFAERWRKICEAFGIEVVRYEVPWGEPFEAAEVARLLQEHPDAVAVFTTLHGNQHRRGARHRGHRPRRCARARRCWWSMASAASGAMECRTDAWGIDVLVVGAQKALMTPPGLAFLAVSPAAWRQIESIRRPAFYFDLLAYRKALGVPDTPYTPAIPLVMALAESLRAIRADGIENVWARGRLLAEPCRAGIEALGLQLVAARPADGMTAVYFPEGSTARRSSSGCRPASA